MSRFRNFLALAAVLVLTSACASSSYMSYIVKGPFVVDGTMAEAKAASAPEGSFNEHLRVKYIKLAELEYEEADWADATWFAEQAVLAGGGKTPDPAIPEAANFREPDSALPELLSARAELLDALNGGARDKSPDIASTAQTMYDCWVQEQEENHQFDEIAACKAGFMDAMAKLKEPMMTKPMAMAEPAARDYLVFFDFDKSNIRDDAAQILSKVMAAIKSLGAEKVQLIGHADRAGASNYNQRLSEKRAANVKAWLSGQGVSGSSITAAGKGESDPRVATPDGVREQENRRVEIHLE